MITQQHNISEIKRHKQKTFCPVTQMQKLNRALAELISLDPSDDMYSYLVDRYLKSLDLYHPALEATRRWEMSEKETPAEKLARIMAEILSAPIKKGGK